MKNSQYLKLIKKAQESHSKPRFKKVRSLPVFGRMSLTSGQEKALDTLWSQAVKARAGNKCEYCPKVEGLQAHHAVGKRWKQSLRHVVSNGVSLCARHHMWAEQHGIEFAQWIISIRGQKWYDDLAEYSREIKVFKDYSVIKAYLESFIKD